MTRLVEALQFLSAASVALFVGALLMEAGVLVPMWRSMRPDDFFALHVAHSHRLYNFFTPLTVSATTLAVLAAAASVASGGPGRLASVVAAALALVILSTYFLYFQRANASFKDASITNDELPAEPTRWARWHWFRTAVGVLAVVAALLPLRSRS